jgi:hypothetical protein
VNSSTHRGWSFCTPPKPPGICGSGCWL